MQATGPDTLVKFLFTSGSTKLPKAVINTQRMICANQQQMRQSMPVLMRDPLVLVDGMPWNHTAGGNHNFYMVLYNGGTLYIDDGKPTPALLGETLRNLREVAPRWQRAPHRQTSRSGSANPCPKGVNPFAAPSVAIGRFNCKTFPSFPQRSPTAFNPTFRRRS